MKKHRKVKRLTSKKDIATLFREGNRIKKTAVILLYLPSKETSITFSVPKRKVKLAVHRHRIKRQMREIYRTTQTATNSPYQLLFIFQKNNEIPFDILFENMQKCLTSLPK